MQKRRQSETKRRNQIEDACLKDRRETLRSSAGRADAGVFGLMDGMMWPCEKWMSGVGVWSDGRRETVGCRTAILMMAPVG